MPIFALYRFDDTGTDAFDSAPADGQQYGTYLDGSYAEGGSAVLDGVDDKVKFYANENFQMPRGTLEIQFNQAAQVGTGPNTVLSRDTVGEHAGGFHIDVLADGSIVVTHESEGSTTTFTTGPGFSAPGDDVQLSYSWAEDSTGVLQINNVTTGGSYTDTVPAGLTMDQGADSQPWIIGAGQSESDPFLLNNINQYFQGTVQEFSLSDTLDNTGGGGGEPTANPDEATTDEDTPVTIAVLANDTDPDGQPLTIDGTPTAEHGTVTVTATGELVYTPDLNYNGPDTITYSITDPDGNVSSSTVAVTVVPVNDAPVAVDDVASTPLDTPVVIDVLANDTDVDNTNAELSILGTPTSADGTVVVNADRTITFTPNPGFIGDAVIEYTVQDPSGATDTGQVIVRTGLTPDGYVDGDDGDNLIDENYLGDPNGDLVDHGDAILPGAAPNDDFIRAGAGNDTVLAGLGNDIVDAGSGDDSVYGGVGGDSILGGDGADTLYGDDGSDLIAGGADDDLIVSSSTSGIPLPDRGYPGLYPADADPFDDRDTVYGGDGNDTIRTGDDADLIYGGTGNDDIDGGIDDDTIEAGDGDDTVVGGEGADVILGGGGNDLIYGGLSPAFPDEINIPDATDLRPDNATDTIAGGAGNDTIFGLDDNDQISGGIGDDSLDGGIDNDTVFGDEGNDTITFGQGVDQLFGGDDRDVFVTDASIFGVAALPDGTVTLIDGGEGGDDYDTLDLRGSGPSRITYQVGNEENGHVDFLDADGNVTGSLNFYNIENVIPCFTPGTRIATPKGEVPVESLQVGDRVITRDNGIQEIRWTGKKAMDWAALSANPHLRPIMIKRGSLGNGLPERDMMVSPNHRVLVANDRTSLYFDEHEVLVAAKHLVGGKGIFEVESIGTSYLHFMFDQHEVVLSDGAWTESFQPGDYTLKGMGNAQRNEIFELFPELKTQEGLKDYAAARRTLKKHEAKLLAR